MSPPIRRSVFSPNLARLTSPSPMTRSNSLIKTSKANSNSANEVSQQQRSLLPVSKVFSSASGNSLNLPDSKSHSDNNHRNSITPKASLSSVVSSHHTASTTSFTPSESSSTEINSRSENENSASQSTPAKRSFLFSNVASFFRKLFTRNSSSQSSNNSTPQFFDKSSKKQIKQLISGLVKENKISEKNITAKNIFNSIFDKNQVPQNPIKGSDYKGYKDYLSKSLKSPEFSYNNFNAVKINEETKELEIQFQSETLRLPMGEDMNDPIVGSIHAVLKSSGKITTSPFSNLEELIENYIKSARENRNKNDIAHEVLGRIDKQYELDDRTKRTDMDNQFIRQNAAQLLQGNEKKLKKLGLKNEDVLNTVVERHVKDKAKDKIMFFFKNCYTAFKNDNSGDKKYEAAVDQMCDGSPNKKYLKENLDNSGFSKKNFEKFSHGTDDDNPYMEAHFKGDKKLRLSRRASSRGEFRDKALKEAINEHNFSNIKELIDINSDKLLKNTVALNVANEIAGCTYDYSFDGNEKFFMSQIIKENKDPIKNMGLNEKDFLNLLVDKDKEQRASPN